MGKIKRSRQRAHAAAVKTKEGQTKQKGEVMATDQDKDVPPGRASAGGNVFQGLDMSKFDLSSKLPDFDTRSTITSKSLKDLKLKKKEKIKMRRDLFLKKMDAVAMAKKAAKDKKRKQKTPIVGDIGAMGDALPTLDLLLREPTGPQSKRENEKKPKGIQKEKKRRKQMLSDIAIFQQVLKHPSFKENPTATISEHLHNKQKQEDMESQRPGTC